NITEIGRDKRTFQKQINNRKETIFLPEGKYRITFEPQEGATTPEPIEVSIQAQSPSQIQAAYKPTKAPPPPIAEIPKQVQLTIFTNTANAKFYLRKSTDAPGKITGRYKGLSNTIPLLPNVKYEIVFEEIPQYKAPDTLTVELKTGEERNVYATYTPL